MPMGLGVRRSVAQEATARSKWENMGVLCPRSLEEWAPNSGKGLSHYNVHQQKLWQQAIFLRWEQKIGVKWPIPRIHLMVIFPFFFCIFVLLIKIHSCSGTFFRALDEHVSMAKWIPENGPLGAITLWVTASLPGLPNSGVWPWGRARWHGIRSRTTRSPGANGPMVGAEFLSHWPPKT